MSVQRVVKPRKSSSKGSNGAGAKWVGNNWNALAEATESNGGVLPESIALVTSDYPNKNVWSEENLPEILFYLSPPPSSFQGSVSTKTREDGTELRDFSVLPDRIAVNVQGWLIEAWRRLDPRISYDDILKRMTADPNFCSGKGLSIPTKNALQMETHRSCRKLLGNWQINGRLDEIHRTMVEGIEKLSYDNLIYNTILPRCEAATSRLVRVKFERTSDDGKFKKSPVTVTAQNLTTTTFPLTYFCQHLPGGIGVFDASMDKAFELLLILQERAEIHGVEHWSKLNKNCRPVTWSNRTKGALPENRPDEDKDGDDRLQLRVDTYDGGCAICTHNEDRDFGRDLTMPEDLPIHDAPTGVHAPIKGSENKSGKVKRLLASIGPQESTRKRIKQAFDTPDEVEDLDPLDIAGSTQYLRSRGQAKPQPEAGVHARYTSLFASPPVNDGEDYPHTASPLREGKFYRRSANVPSSPPALESAPFRHYNDLNAHPGLLGYHRPESTNPRIKEEPTYFTPHAFMHDPPFGSTAMTSGMRSGFSGSMGAYPLATSFGFVPVPHQPMYPLPALRHNLRASPMIPVQRRTVELQRALGGDAPPFNWYDLPQDMNVQTVPSWSSTGSHIPTDTGNGFVSRRTHYTLSGSDASPFKQLGDGDAMAGTPTTPPLQPDLSIEPSLSFGHPVTPPQIEWSDDFFRHMLHSDPVNGHSDDDLLLGRILEPQASPTMRRSTYMGHSIKARTRQNPRASFGQFINDEDEFGGLEEPRSYPGRRTQNSD